MNSIFEETEGHIYKQELKSQKTKEIKKKSIQEEESRENIWGVERRDKSMPLRTTRFSTLYIQRLYIQYETIE